MICRIGRTPAAAAILHIGLLAAVLLGDAEDAGAQVAWDAPFMVAPRMGDGWGLALLEPAGGDLGVVGHWRGSGGTLGLRGGLADTSRDDIALFGGVDVSGSLVRTSSEFPLDIDWIAGAGVGIGDDVLLSAPFGVTIGRGFSSEGVAFGPYVSPRLILDAWFGDDDGPGDDDGLDLDIAVDLGIDVAFDPGWTLRFGATLGDREALAFGFAVH